jgi:hypothetical protein
MRKLIATREESEWLVRVTLQLFNLSEPAFADPHEREQFKTRLMSMVEILRECRDAQLDLGRLIETHTKELEAGDAARITDGRIELLKDIEPRLNRYFKDFFSKARVVLYHLYGQRDKPESVTFRLLGRSVNFVQIENEATFEKCVAEFLQADPSDKARALMDMLRGERQTWSAVLIGTRNRIDHDIDCPKLQMNYEIIAGKVRAGFPTVSKQELRAYVDQFWCNLYQAVEETVALCLTMRMPDNIVLRRIPDLLKNPQLLFRWTLTSDPGHPILMADRKTDH